MYDPTRKKKSQSPSAHAEHSEMRKFFFFFFGEKLINGARHSKQRILATDHSMHCFNFIYLFNMCAKLMHEIQHEPYAKKWHQIKTVKTSSLRRQIHA
jgi:hypothetical protein